MLQIAQLDKKPEIFYSIQGEGKSIGKPSIFIRLSLCNLYCFWCDTDYTWNWEGTNYPHLNDKNPNYQKFNKADSIIKLTEKQIIAEIQKYNCHRLIFTGGEPLVQQKKLLSLLAQLKKQNPQYHIEFETNGTIIPIPELEALTNQYNVSLKLENSKVRLQERLKPKAIHFFAQNDKANFKFVVDSPKDLDEILEIIQKYAIFHDKVYLMPQGTKPAILRKKQQWLVEICKQYQFNYTDRLHILIYGDKRGI
ncbi:7-carboxy-7-deazaguanine synthase QueE [Raineya orbicola]|jgi:organic radical activating enzyme|uniref:7-carboxy-7-deazaguanine synthase n=1 Tax=Raineya orbicola TaxID=2016530 RepID=A0A2N3ID87_9BACT|nr:7-carboxy-7-deazaguanine synthase QueE [Raineya orbicola]PKQ68281.1 Organic radical activating enzyme [Raineya orbicola]